MNARVRASKALKIVSGWSILLALLACGGGDGTSTSSSTPSSTISVAPGFTPDPQTRTGTTRGAFSANTRNAACRGYIGAITDFTINVTQPFTNLRVLVSATQDTTLVIQMADGSYRCDDDGGEGSNPLIEGAFPTGRHRVYVGSYSQNQRIDYTFGVTELSSVSAATLVGGAALPPQPTAVPAAGGSNYGTVTLAPNFMPDPNISRGQAGGPVSANTLNPACRGYVAARPDHELVLSGNFANLRVLVQSAQDTTLVVRSPDGTYRCDDDSEGFNPIVAGAFAPGTYQVYVGSYSAAATGVPYVIGFSELNSVTAAQLQ